MAKEKKGSAAFAVAQQIGKSLFLPIAILPFAGILLGIGSSFTNPTTIATYGLQGVLHEGGVLYNILLLMSNAGNAIFGNLALIFALAVALGMAKKEKGVATLSAGIFYIIMHVVINTLLTIDGTLSGARIREAGAVTDILGISTLNMGVFGGIIAGLITAALCNKFYKIQLPAALSFFAGTRFVPIVSIATAIVTGAIFYFIWPFIQSGIYALGGIVQASGYFGTFIYGCIERALIPFGLHHIFYMPFWQTGMGGSMEIGGEMIYGAQNIFFAQLADPNTTKFSIDACRFLTGKFPFMMGGLPGAALAMYTCAKPEKKKQTASLMFSVALTSFITGITEPIEFTFLFLAPALFGIHVALAGVSFVICHVLQICVGTTFSDGLIDFILYGVLPGQAKSNWIMLVPVILVFFVIYFIVFRFFILHWDIKTPGREEGDGEVKMMSKAEYQAATGVGVAGGAKLPANFDEKSAMILKFVGGVHNVTEIDCCATRLRLTLKDSSKVDQQGLKATGASGVVIKGNAIQVIYGPQVTIIKSNFEEFVEDVRVGKIPEDLLGDSAAPAAAAPAAAKPSMPDETLGAHANGKMLLMNEVEDEAFASAAMGYGAAIEPSEGKLYAPADGTVEMVFDTKHAVTMVTKGGAEVLLHIGIDTVKLNGKHFTTHVQNDQAVKKGDLLISFDIPAIKKEGYKVTIPCIICNTDDYASVLPLKTGDVKAGDDFVDLKG